MKSKFKLYNHSDITSIPTNAKTDDSLFKNPTAEYRGTPFWSWNCKLEEKELLRQIDVLKEMGLGGFHIHSRTGLEDEYLGEHFMNMVKSCRDHAEKNNMLCWLYDEDRWPSGFAGGLVTNEEKYRMEYLLFTPVPYGTSERVSINNSLAAGGRNEKGTLLARYRVILKNGALFEYQRLSENEGENNNQSESQNDPDSHIWYLYKERTQPSTWFNNQGYANTLDKKTIEKFIEVTHEKYKAKVGDSFGKSIPAIFTDEPQFTHKQTLSFPEEKKDIALPYTSDFPDTYTATYNADFFLTFPELIWELPDNKVSLHRYRYHDHIAERFASAFADTIGQWCEKNDIALSGHLMEEPTLASQSAALGDAMRSYRSFQLPGIDILCDHYEYTTAKQAQSAARQYGRPGVMSELYGVTGWEFSFTGHKTQGDWQVALGITVRVPHLSWVSMKGEAKRDYPASISYQSPWYKEYKVVEDHFARVNTLMTRGKAVCNVAVIHPIESYWLLYGPNLQTKGVRTELDESFQNITKWLLEGLVDFDFVSESLIVELCEKWSNKTESQSFCVGEMTYNKVILPGMITIRSTTLDALEKFVSDGGKLVFAGEVPKFVDALPSDRALALAEKTVRIPFTKHSLLSSVEEERVVDFIQRDGTRPEGFLYQLRSEKNCMHLFLCNPAKTLREKPGTIEIKGEWRATFNDTATGEKHPLTTRCESGKTFLDWTFPPAGHVLLTLEKSIDPSIHLEQSSSCADECGDAMSQRHLQPTLFSHSEVARNFGKFSISLDEPNVLLLDKAAWRLEETSFSAPMEILEIQNDLRKHLGLDSRSGHMAQPWTEKEKPIHYGRVTLQMNFETETEIANAKLALEDAYESTVMLDGKPVTAKTNGYWVDKAIETLPLPHLSRGKHTLEITFPFTSARYTEWYYLLGDFGVRLEGTVSVLTPPVKELGFGDITSQGLPFYGGNITYHIPAPACLENGFLHIPHFKGTLCNVTRQSGNSAQTSVVAYPPYRSRIGKVEKGEMFDVTLFTSRANCFGPVHWFNEHHNLWCGPNAWRTGGTERSDEYQLVGNGIVTSVVWEEGGDENSAKKLRTL